MQPEFKMHTIKIFIVCTAVFIVQNIYPSFTELFSLNSLSVVQQPWTLVTYMFLHASLEHYISNMFALMIFCLILEKVIGSRNFLILYFASGIFSGMAGILFYNSVIGASGAIFGSMASLALLRPNLTVWIGYVPMPMVIALFVWAAASALGLFVPSNIADAGHLAGIAFGIIYTLAKLRHFSEKPEKKYKIKISEEIIREWERRYM